MKKYIFSLVLVLSVFNAFAQSINLPSPAGSMKFGTSVTVLPNGNYVVTDPDWKNGSLSRVGAVYLYNGQTNVLISTLTGSNADDKIGDNGITVLSNGNFVIRSTNWKNGTITVAGAVTWGSSITGINGVVSAGNSLVGAQTNESIGYTPITVLPGGNYLVINLNWKNGMATKAGAVTWCNGITGTSGVVSAGNSLVGTQANDEVGNFGAKILTNGNYVVVSKFWKNGTAAQAGAVTWGSGNTGVKGAVSAANSLVGTVASSQVGTITPLPNGNYLVSATLWKTPALETAGALTWGSGTAGVTGEISAANSLVGSHQNDYVGSFFLLSNGNYIATSSNWNGNRGAAAWASGATGIRGVVSSSNSLVGGQAGDQVGGFGIQELTNGNYLVSSSSWQNGTLTNAGALTWCSGTAGITGLVSAANSLVGSTQGELVGNFAVLTNGNYVATTPNWDNGTLTNVGAVTWCNGTTGLTGVITAANSLIGGQANDVVGRVTALSNGNYVVTSPYWSNGTTTSVGAVTWVNGTVSTSGTVNSTNSIIGGQANDRVGLEPTTPLKNGSYVINSSGWNNGAATNAGAATWGSGTGPTVGVVSSSNSLVGLGNDRIGYNNGIKALPNGNYLVSSAFWNNGALTEAGAVTWGNGNGGTVGVAGPANSLVGSRKNDKIGRAGITVLKNSSYLVRSDYWNNGVKTRVGAVTWGSGTAGVSGFVDSNNSLVGNGDDNFIGREAIVELANGNYVVPGPSLSRGFYEDAGSATWGSGTSGVSGTITPEKAIVGLTRSDYVGETIEALSNGNYLVYSPAWNNGLLRNTGAVTLGNGAGGTVGVPNFCNSVLGINEDDIRVSSAAYNSLFDKLIVGQVGRYGSNRVTIFSPAQSNLAMSTTTATDKVVVPAALSFRDTFCALIATVQPVAPAPVKGSVKVAVYIQPTAPTTPATGEAYVRRYYRLLPADSADFNTARLTLYFTQSEFDDYNNTPGTTAKLPTGPTDATGKAALRVTQQRGISATGAFGSFTGFAGSGPANVLLIPGDSNVVWNAPLFRWEVSFPVTGFGGFFLSAGNDAPLSLPAEIHNISGITVSPIPAGNAITITNSNPQLAGSTVTALNLQGQVMATAILSSSTQIEVQNWPAGIYLLKFANGSVVKVVKQ